MKKADRLSIAPFALLLALALLAVACAGRADRGARDPSSPAPRLLGVFAAWANTLPAVDGLAVGSLSALAYDGTSRRWVGASDEIQQPRLVWFELGLGPAITVVPTATTRLTLGPGLPQDTLTALDMEGLALFPDGSFAVSHEGHIDRTGTARQPRVLRVTRDGVVTDVIRPRPAFAIDPADRARGVRHNLGFEGLTRTPAGRLVAGLEQPLAQDGPVSSRERGGVVRLAEFVETGGAWAPGREWAYALEPTPAVDGYTQTCADGENGLSALLALSETTFLAVERACLLGPPGATAYNPVRVFMVDVDGADDVSGLPSLAGASPVLARKRLVQDLAAWRPQLPASLRTLANFEGAALGPPGPRGERTVMLVSDDNFRPTQTTAFLWFTLP